MTVRLSTGLRNAQAKSLGFAGALHMGYIDVYSGSQPVTADSVKGTLLLQLTLDGGALTKETRATGTVTITGASDGTINEITIGGLNIIPDGVVTAASDTTSTLAAKLCEAINRNGLFQATVSSAVVTIRGRPGSGAVAETIAGDLTTVTASYSALGTASSGVAPVNGLYLDTESVGVIAKPSGVVWRGVGVAQGTAAWARFYSSDTADTGAALSAAPWYPRLDGNCGVGSGDFQLSTLAITVGLPVTLDTFNWTQPAA